jgi:hypothetical protein
VVLAQTAPSREGATDTVTSAGSRRLTGMRKVAILHWSAGALLTVVVVACSPGAATFQGAGVVEPSAPASAAAPPPTPVQTAAPTATPTAEVSQVETPVVLDVACDGSRTVIAMPVVLAQLDGVHLRIGNASGIELPFDIEDVGGSSVPVAGGSFTYGLEPGTHRVSCAADLVAFEVVDPIALYKRTECAGSASGTTGVSEFVDGARGLRGTLLDVARRQLLGLHPGDVVERAGYPQATGDAQIRVVRGAEVLAVLSYHDDGAGGWLLGGTRMCPGSDLTIVMQAD